MGPIWGRQDPGRPYVGSMNFDIWADKIIIPRIVKPKIFTPRTANEKYFAKIVCSLLDMFSLRALGLHFDDIRHVNIICRQSPRLVLRVIRSLWYLPIVSAAMLPRYLSIHRWFDSFITPYVFRDFEESHDQTSYAMMTPNFPRCIWK